MRLPCRYLCSLKKMVFLLHKTTRLKTGKLLIFFSPQFLLFSFFSAHICSFLKLWFGYQTSELSSQAKNLHFAVCTSRNDCQPVWSYWLCRAGIYASRLLHLFNELVLITYFHDEHRAGNRQFSSVHARALWCSLFLESLAFPPLLLNYQPF